MAGILHFSAPPLFAPLMISWAVIGSASARCERSGATRELLNLECRLCAERTLTLQSLIDVTGAPCGFTLAIKILQGAD